MHALAAAPRGRGIAGRARVGGFGAAAIVALLRAAVRQLRATRSFQRALPVIGRLPGVPDVAVVDSPTPEAFCAGLLRPRVYVSTTALRALSRPQLAAVLAHERHHAARRDPLRLLVARTVAEGMFFLPVLGRLTERYAALTELAADEAALQATGGPKALASALLAFDSHTIPAAVGISPQRVDSLLGARLRWELPGLMIAAAAVTLAGVAAVAIRLAQATDHASLPLPVVLALYEEGLGVNWAGRPGSGSAGESRGLSGTHLSIASSAG